MIIRQKAMDVLICEQYFYLYIFYRDYKMNKPFEHICLMGEPFDQNFNVCNISRGPGAVSEERQYPPGPEFFALGCFWYFILKLHKHKIFDFFVP